MEKHRASSALPVLFLAFLFALSCSAGGRAGAPRVEAARVAMASSVMSSKESGAYIPDSAYSNGLDFAGAQAEAPVASQLSAAGSVPLAGDGSAPRGRKLIKNGYLEVRAEDLPAAEKSVGELMERFGAFIASASARDNFRTFTIRVPAQDFDAMLAELAALGKTLSKTENAEDVTLEYYDLEGRLATQRELLKTYQSYLSRANTIEEIMTVERHIADLQREIDMTGTGFRNLGDRIDYGTINLEISGPPSAGSSGRPTLPERLGALVGSFGEIASTALVALAGLLLYGIPALLIAAALLWLLFGRLGLLRRLFRLVMGDRKSARTGERVDQ